MKPDYGLDFPARVRDLAIRACLFLAAGAGLWISNGANPVAWISLVIGLGFGVMVLVYFNSSRTGKLQMRDRLLDSITWKGDEKVLDVGCGRGLLLIGAAKRLQTGRATGVDIWRKEELSDNSPEAVRDLATAEGVLPKIKIETADAQKLAFPDASFDVVVSSSVVHLVPDRTRALSEMVRVLKPGGQLRIFDLSDCSHDLQDLSLTGITVSPPSWLWCHPSRTVSAIKKV
ncbi:MAG TPA: class I SAM-dependent methyltransferase [Bryobacteraceae bacterium]|nr:class I SAM-dependent methyltransferase [Bryobacteraceae bacterium]